MTFESEHAWIPGEEFPFTASQVKRAGDRIRRAAEQGREPTVDDLSLLDLFRSWHGAIHNSLQLRLGEAIVTGGSSIPTQGWSITGRPLKTHEAIIAKLVREKSRLNRIQDIVGARIAVPDLETQEAVLQVTLRTFEADEAVVAKDTRETADELGYRGVHVVVRVDGRFAEIQIRTALQGLWAQVVEKIDESFASDLKHGSGDNERLQWLQEFSARLQRVERGEKLDWQTAVEGLVAIMITRNKDEHR